jgi:alanine racemase
MNNTWLEIDAAVLAENIHALNHALDRETQTIFVVKSDAYGHGLVPIALHAHRVGIRWFGVAHLHEALSLRKVLPDVDILMMGVAFPAEVPLLAAERITPMVVSLEHGQGLAAAARAVGQTVSGHLKVDTGMGRLGVAWPDAPATFAALEAEDGLHIAGVCSHFSAVEPKQPTRAEQQVERFLEVVQPMEARRGRPLFKHISSSRAILYHREWDLDAIRPGICLYGYGTADPDMRFNTHPFLQWKCRVMQVKSVPAGYPVGYYGTHVTPAPTRMAVLSAGYADGYHRALSNRGHVLIRGRRCRVIGRVSMNWITVDLGPDGAGEAGDEAVLIGRQGPASVWAGELAKICRTIPYEILVGIHHVAERRYMPG